MTQAYPLHWPQNWPRSRAKQRSKFSTTHRSFSGLCNDVYHEIKLLGGHNAIVSTNLKLRNDGLPYSQQRQPEDTGVAVYFTFKGQQKCFACDRWEKMEENLRAISLTIGALRGIDRWGSGDMVEAAFRGFEALPAPSSSNRPWWEVLCTEKDAPIVSIENNYRSLARKYHPDNGGSAEKMAELNSAIAEARKLKGRAA